MRIRKRDLMRIIREEIESSVGQKDPDRDIRDVVISTRDILYVAASHLEQVLRIQDDESVLGEMERFYQQDLKSIEASVGSMMDYFYEHTDSNDSRWS